MVSKLFIKRDDPTIKVNFTKLKMIMGIYPNKSYRKISSYNGLDILIFVCVYIYNLIIETSMGQWF